MIDQSDSIEKLARRIANQIELGKTPLVVKILQVILHFSIVIFLKKVHILTVVLLKLYSATMPLTVFL